jgi:hypothetical protein
MRAVSSVSVKPAPRRSESPVSRLPKNLRLFRLSSGLSLSLRVFLDSGFAIEPAAVEMDRSLEALAVGEATGRILNPFDLRIQALRHGVRDAMREVGAEGGTIGECSPRGTV